MAEFPSANTLVEEAKQYNPKTINELHRKTYDLMRKYRSEYYKQKVGDFLKTTSLKEPQISEIKKKMLQPVSADGIKYSNFMEEASRRISQTFQVISGNIAELCAEAAVKEAGLQENVHYLRKKDRSDFIFYHPELKNQKAKHRLEVKNVKLRERGVRGLAFDGDSLFGFFDDPSEFTEDNIIVLEEHCKKTGGYCYIPPETLKNLKHPVSRFRSNLHLAKDMKNFVETGSIL